MAIIGVYAQQPADRLDYDVDATEWLNDDDTLAEATVTVSPTGLTVDGPLIFDSGRRAKVFASGGASGIKYKLDVTLTTTLGRVKQDEIIIRVKEI